MLALCLMPSSSNAQKQWTLEECIQYALAHNIQIKQNTEHPLQRFEPRGRTTVEGSTLPEPFGQHEPERGL